MHEADISPASKYSETLQIRLERLRSGFAPGSYQENITSIIVTDPERSSLRLLGFLKEQHPAQREGAVMGQS